jgi:hypothetical protein
MNIWPGIALLVGIALMALAFTLPTIIRDFRERRNRRRKQPKH